VGAGRVADGPDGRGLRTALRQLAERHELTFLITPQQDLVIADVPAAMRSEVDALLVEHRVRSLDELGPVERSALACPALPTCGQALAEAERRLPEVVGLVEGALAASGLGRRALQLRMTGCPNGCARPAVAEVGIVGRTKSSYDLYLGGGPRGDRLATLHREKVKLEDLPEVLEPLLARWRDEGLEGEAFGDFFHRVGP
jgi:sulfite reductase beta subunit-like hemoprotein